MLQHDNRNGRVSVLQNAIKCEIFSHGELEPAQVSEKFSRSAGQRSTLFRPVKSPGDRGYSDCF